MPKNRKVNNKSRGTRVAHMPRQIVTRPVQNMTIRYTTTSGTVDQIITSQHLLCLLLAVSTETTSAQATFIFGGVRVRSIDIYSQIKPADAGGGLTRVAFEWLGNPSYAKPVELEAWGDLSKPAHLHAVPPPNSLGPRNWCTVGSNSFNVFRLSAVPTGSIIDLNFDYILADQSDVSTEAGTEATLTIPVVSGVFATYLGNDTDIDPTGWNPVVVSSIPLRRTKSISPPQGEEEITFEEYKALVAARRQPKSK